MKLMIKMYEHVALTLHYFGMQGFNHGHMLCNKIT